MRRTRFLISTLAAAGFGSVDTSIAALTAASAGDDDGQEGSKIFRIFKQDHAVTLAQHRSHRSHSSHRSHRSGAGGYSYPRGGGYSPPPTYVPPPARAYSPPPPAYVPPAAVYTAPDTSASSLEASAAPPQRVLNARSSQFASIVRRVQIGLLAQGFYERPIDGVVGPQLRSAIRQLQTTSGLQVTGTITSEVLDALKVPSQ